MTTFKISFFIEGIYCFLFLNAAQALPTFLWNDCETFIIPLTASAAISFYGKNVRVIKTLIKSSHAPAAFGFIWQSGALANNILQQLRFSYTADFK